MGVLESRGTSEVERMSSVQAVPSPLLAHGRTKSSAEQSSTAKKGGRRGREDLPFPASSALLLLLLVLARSD